MKKTIFITALGLFSGLSAMEVKLADQETLKEQLKLQGVPERTIEVIQLHTHFGGKTMDPSQIPAEYDAFLSKHIEKAETPERKQFITSHLQKHKPTAVKVFLHDHPEVLAAVLEQLNNNQDNQ